MKRELIQDFTLRVTQASKTELVVIMYDVILEDIAAAVQTKLEGDNEKFVRELKHAGKFIHELIATLDFTISLSHELLSLYSFVNKLLIKAQIEKDVKHLEHITSIIGKLRSSFAELSAKDATGPVMRNTQKLYAGLTYGKGTLNEAYIDPNEANRGFKA